MSHWLLRLAGAMQEGLPPEPSTEAIEAAKAVDDRWVGLYTDEFYADMLREAYAAEQLVAAKEEEKR